MSFCEFPRALSGQPALAEPEGHSPSKGGPQPVERKVNQLLYPLPLLSHSPAHHLGNDVLDPTSAPADPS